VKRGIGAKLIASLLLACAGPVEQREWIEVSTPNFRVYSTLGADETSAMALRLELFRTVASKIATVPTLEPVVQTRILLFDKRYDFQAFEANRSVVGFFVQRMRANYAVIRRDRQLDETQALLHEYVHFLMANGPQRMYPRWYAEGFAEFLRTLATTGDTVVVGAFPMDRKAEFRRALRGGWAPFHEIVGPRGASFPMFYPQSWALVHWLMLGRTGRNAGADLSRYLDLIEAGESVEPAFESAFGIRLQDADVAIRRYLDGEYKAVGLRLAAFGHVPPDPVIRSMSEGEASLALAGLALSLDDFPRAAALFSAARAALPASARAHAGLGITETQRGNWEAAGALFERALALDPDDAEIQLDRARHLHALALAENDPSRRSETLARARRHYLRSSELDPKIPETWARYGSTFSISGEDTARGIEGLEHAHRLLPSSPEVQLLLARAYLRAGREVDAIALAERAVAHSHVVDREANLQALLQPLVREDDAGLSAGFPRAQ